MTIAEWSVKRPVAVTMWIASLVLLGAMCLLRLPVDLLPKVSLPTVVVVTNWPNVAPEEIEAQVTRPVERAVSSVTGLYEVNSTTDEGSSSVRVQFQWGTDIDQAAIDVLQQVQRATRNFPTDPTLQMPTVFKVDPAQSPILVYGISGIDDPVKLRTLLDNQISPIVEAADGVGAVNVTGGITRAIMVEPDPIRMRAHHLSANQIVARIAAENQNLPAGIAKQGKTEYVIRTIGWFESVRELAKMPVGSLNGQVIALSDVAKVSDSHQETRRYTRLNGQPAVGLIVTKQSDANAVSTAEAVQQKIAQASKLYPNLQFRCAYNQAEFIENSINNLMEHAILGGVLAVLILLFFLRNFRSTLVVALSIPTSIVSTFALLYMCGFTINTMSLGGLALATGLIVDDAVVILENTFRHIERDKLSPARAAIAGTNELMAAVTASTFTVMIVFLPLLLIKGQSGQMFTQFALVVVFSIAISLLDATTLVPMLCSRIISSEAHHAGGTGFWARLFDRCGEWFDALDRKYRSGLRWALGHRAWVLIGAASVSAGGLLLAPYLGSEMMPQTDSGDFTVSVKMPPGTALSETYSTVLQVERIILANPDVETAFAAAGTTMSLRGTSTADRPQQGSFTVSLKENRRKPTQQIVGELRRQFAQIPGGRIFPTQYDLVTNTIQGGQPNIEIDIFGEDLSTLSSLAQQVMTRVRSVPGYENVDVNWQEATPELQWRIDRQKALQMGLSFSDVASLVGTATNGTIASYYQERGFQYPIIVQMPESDRKTLPSLLTLPIRPASSQAGGASAGNYILLEQIAAPKEGVGPSQITRRNRQRYIAVTGTPQGRSDGEIQADIDRALKDLNLPPGYYRDWGSFQKRRAEEFSGMGMAVAMAIMLIYMLLASQYESFVDPLTVLFSVPLCAVGVVLALFLTERAFGLTAFIGLLMLVGIVVKNGILLVDYTNVLRRKGMMRNEAVLTAGPTRLRPILMTTMATICGMFMIALGIGRGSETQAPMATAVIGGLTTSTLLTLFVVPTVYTLFDDLGHIIRRRRRDASPPPATTTGAGDGESA